MSVRVMEWVWKHSRAEGTARLVLLAIADHAHDDGGGAWPSQESLARKCRVSKKTIQRGVETLEKLEELRVEKYGGPVIHGTQGQRTHKYTILMTNQSDNLTNCPVDDDRPVGHSDRPVGQPDPTSWTTVSNEPSIDPLLKPSSDELKERSERERLARRVFDNCKPVKGQRAGLDSCRKLIARAREELGLSIHEIEQRIGRAITLHGAYTLAFFRGALEGPPEESRPLSVADWQKTWPTTSVAKGGRQRPDWEATYAAEGARE